MSAISQIMGEIFEEPLQVDPISTGGFSSMDENSIQDYQKDAVMYNLMQLCA